MLGGHGADSVDIGWGERNSATAARLVNMYDVHMDGVEKGRYRARVWEESSNNVHDGAVSEYFIPVRCGGANVHDAKGVGRSRQRRTELSKNTRSTLGGREGAYGEEA